MKRIMVLILIALFASSVACSTIAGIFTGLKFSQIAGNRTSTPIRSNLPGRIIPSTPLATSPHTPSITQPTIDITSPFDFPTASSISPTPHDDCTTVFPFANVEEIEFGTTTLEQLETVFGRGTAGSGRSTRFKFEADSCVLWIILADNVAQEAELVNYGTLELLLDQYGEPAEIGISEGNLTLLDVGSTVMFYPDEGVFAIFAVDPAALTQSTPIDRLFVRRPYQVEKQLTRLNVSPIEWQLSPQ